MESLKECLNIVIRSLPPATTLFNLVGFGSSYKILFTDERTPPAPTSYLPSHGKCEHRSRACACVRRWPAEGAGAQPGDVRPGDQLHPVDGRRHGRDQHSLGARGCARGPAPTGGQQQLPVPAEARQRRAANALRCRQLFDPAAVASAHVSASAVHSERWHDGQQAGGHSRHTPQALDQHHRLHIRHRRCAPFPPLFKRAPNSLPASHQRDG